MSKLVLNIITYNRLYQFWENVLKEKEYFDEVRIFDLDSTDGTKGFCETHGLTYIPCKFGYSIVKDGYNKILEYANEGEWVLLHDSDEWFTIDFLRNIRRMVNESNNGENYNSISTIPLDINLDAPVCSEYEKKVCHQDLGETIEQAFKKEVMFKYSDGLYYEGGNHHQLMGIDRKPLYIYYGYYHAKTVKEICQSCVFLTAGDMIGKDFHFAVEHFSEKEIKYLTSLFKTKRINTIPKFHKFWDSKKFDDKFIKFCENCFEIPKVDVINNGNIVSQRMAWFMYMFIFKYPELINKVSEDKQKFFSDKWFYRG